MHASQRQHKDSLPSGRTHGAACERSCLPARRVKLAAVYLSMTLLCLIFAVLIVRGVLALVTWVALGRCLWLFPFLLSEARRGRPPPCRPTHHGRRLSPLCACGRADPSVAAPAAYAEQASRLCQLSHPSDLISVRLREAAL